MYDSLGALVSKQKHLIWSVTSTFVSFKYPEKTNLLGLVAQLKESRLSEGYHISDFCGNIIHKRTAQVTTSHPSSAAANHLTWHSSNCCHSSYSIDFACRNLTIALSLAVLRTRRGIDTSKHTLWVKQTFKYLKWAGAGSHISTSQNLITKFTLQYEQWQKELQADLFMVLHHRELHMHLQQTISWQIITFLCYQKSKTKQSHTFTAFFS